MDNQSENFADNKVKLGKSNKKVRIYSLGIKITALLCMVMFFFPMCTVSCTSYDATYEENLSGWDCAVGKEIFEGDGTVDPHPFAFALVIIPAILLVTALTVRSKAEAAGLLLGISQIVALLVFRNSIIDTVNAQGKGLIGLKFTSWYTLNVICAGVSALLGGLGFIETRSSKHIAKEDMT